MKRIGIVYDTSIAGRGGHDTHYAFKGLPDVEIAALADSNTESLAERMAKMEAKRHYATWQEMLDQEPLDVIDVCSRLPGDHFEVICAALRRGISVFCEKPLVSTLEEADEIVRLAHENNCRVCVAHLARYALVFRTMKALIQQGKIGRPLTFYGRGKEDGRGGGEDLLVLGTHILDVGCFLFGHPTSVYAEITQNGASLARTDRMETTEPLGIVAGTDLFSTFAFPDGVRGVFESRRGLYKGTVRMGVTVAGTEGCLSMRYDNCRDLRFTPSPYPPEDEAHYEVIPLTETHEIPNAAPLDFSLVPSGDGVHRYFIVNNRFAAYDLLQAMDEGCEPVASAAEAAVTMELINGMYESEFRRERIALPLTARSSPFR